jgi:hypothetical protein
LPRETLDHDLHAEAQRGPVMIGRSSRDIHAAGGVALAGGDCP